MAWLAPADARRPRHTARSLAHAYLPRIGVTYGPAVAALVLARLTGGPDAARRLVRGAFPRWRDLPLALAILVTGIALAALALVGREWIPAN